MPLGTPREALVDTLDRGLLLCQDGPRTANRNPFQGNDMVRASSTGKHRPMFRFLDFLERKPNLLNESESLTSGASAVAVDVTVYKTEITTGGTAGSEDVTIGDGTVAPAAVVGERHLIELTTRTNASDVVNLDHANIHNAAGTQATNVDLDAAGEFVLLEWTGSEWQIIYSDATVAP